MDPFCKQIKNPWAIPKLSLKPLDNIGKTEKQTFSQIYT